VIDAECVAFLQWALPRLGLHWPGYRKVRAQACKRIARRARSLGLPTLAAYRARLERDPDEWSALAAQCTVTISRFWRDRAVFDALSARVLPALAQAARERGSGRVDAWSAGCASGEEAYSLALAWRFGPQARFPEIQLDILGTDVDPVLIERARSACYRSSSLDALPADWREAAFERRDDRYCLRGPLRAGVEFARQDLRAELPERSFDAILCRNLAFTYFGAALARDALGRLGSRLRPGGALVVGLHERLPERAAGFVPWPDCRAVYRRAD
jgi:chemotaxis protein methyltransferase CheR